MWNVIAAVNHSLVLVGIVLRVKQLQLYSGLLLIVLSQMKLHIFVLKLLQLHQSLLSLLLNVFSIRLAQRVAAIVLDRALFCVIGRPREKLIC
jgi:hypothetical protein